MNALLQGGQPMRRQSAADGGEPVRGLASRFDAIGGLSRAWLICVVLAAALGPIALAPRLALAGLAESRVAVSLFVLGQKSKLDDAEEEEEEEPPASGAKEEEADAEEETPPEETDDDASDGDAMEEEEETPPEEGSDSEEGAEEKESENESDADSENEAMDEEEEEPPSKKSKLDESEEEEEPPPKSKSSDEEEEVEEMEEEPSEDSDKRKSSLDSDSDEDSSDDEESEEPQEPVCDLLFYSGRDGDEKAMKLRLLEEWPKLPLLRNLDYQFAQHLSDKKGKSMQRFKGSQVRRFEYYEDRMGDLAAREVKSTWKKLASPGAALDISPPGLAAHAQKAEKLLLTALSEHDSAVGQNLRQGPEWEARLRRPLVHALFNIRLGQIDQLLREEKGAQAEKACDRLLESLGGEEDERGAALRSRFEQIFIARARTAHAAQDYAGAREAVDQLADRYPLVPVEAVIQFREGLMAEARGLIARAESAQGEDQRRALELVEEAAKIWPELPAIDQRRKEWDEAYPLLECAYGELPRNISPLSARTPVERHAVALVFESLVRWTDDPESGAHYEPQLALGRPTPLAKGRQFQLPRSKWSDYTDEQPHLCTMEDVRWTVSLLHNKALRGYSPSWAQLVAGVDDSDSGDPFVATVRLHRDYWQPMSLMDFMILPKHRFPAGGNREEQLAEFSRAPVGTGPYSMAEPEADRVRFLANPHYREPGLPYIREIAFNRLDPGRAVELFLQGKMHLVYGVRREHVNQLDQQRRAVKNLRTPSVWFLAPNYRQTALKNEDLRLAIANGIDRKAILDQFFRPGRGPTDHVELNGPYPAGSWASNPKVPPFDPAKAKAYADNARKQAVGGTLPTLRLVYPGGDPDVENACKQIQSQLALLQIKLELESVAAADFTPQIVERQDFDLAYWRHDYEDETYWLWPLLDPDPKAREKGGPNFMGFVPDKDTDGFFRDLTRHKRFTEVQELTHKIHDHIYHTAGLIPLWQLDTYVAIDSSLSGVTLDPLVLFGDVQHWKLKPREEVRP